MFASQLELLYFFFQTIMYDTCLISNTYHAYSIQIPPLAPPNNVERPTRKWTTRGVTGKFFWGLQLFSVRSHLTFPIFILHFYFLFQFFSNFHPSFFFFPFFIIFLQISHFFTFFSLPQFSRLVAKNFPVESVWGHNITCIRAVNFWEFLGVNQNT